MTELIAATGVTRTAVTEQLNELVAADYIERTQQRSGRGRPKHLYSLTSKALRLLFANNQQLMAPAMLEAMRELGGEAFSRQVMIRAGERLLAHYRNYVTATTPVARLYQLAERLQVEGIVVEIEQTAEATTLSCKTCPYIDLVEPSRTVCQVEAEMIGKLVDRLVIMQGNRLDGASCCTFAMVAPPEMIDRTGEPPLPVVE